MWASCNFKTKKYCRHVQVGHYTFISLNILLTVCTHTMNVDNDSFKSFSTQINVSFTFEFDIVIPFHKRTLTLTKKKTTRSTPLEKPMRKIYNSI